MSITKKLINSLVRRHLESHELAVIPKHLAFPWQVAPMHGASDSGWSASPDALSYLRWDNDRLLDISRRYGQLPKELLSHPVWTQQHLNEVDILNFRGDNSYVWQRRGRNLSDLSYALAYYCLKSEDVHNYLDVLDEDAAFGAYAVQIRGKLVSRDLLDSLSELLFLERRLDVNQKNFTILDIGAGYGRLAHRAITLFSNMLYLCTDAIATSSFLCEYYLRFRNVNPRAQVIPCDSISSTVALQRIDLAVNIHSFSECSLAAVSWWMELLLRNEVRYLFIVPNANQPSRGGRELITKDGSNFGDVIRKYGYKFATCEPKFKDPLVQLYGLNPTYYHLYELA